MVLIQRMRICTVTVRSCSQVCGPGPTLFNKNFSYEVPSCLGATP